MIECVDDRQHHNSSTYSWRHAVECSDSTAWILIQYIENVKRIDPNYDASCIKNTFDFESKDLTYILTKYPDLKLNIRMKHYDYLQKERHLHKIQENGNIPKLITHMNVSEYFLNNIPDSVTFPNVIDIEVPDGIRSGRVSDVL